MGSLFSSPSKQATSAAQAAGGIDQGIIGNLENYVSGEQGKLRGAIANQGPNPYFQAAQDMSPQGYAVNPSNAVTFGAGGPGTTAGTNSTVNASAPAPIQSAPPPPPPKPPTQPPQNPFQGRGPIRGPIRPFQGQA